MHFNLSFATGQAPLPIPTLGAGLLRSQGLWSSNNAHWTSLISLGLQRANRDRVEGLDGIVIEDQRLCHHR
jgi:hypothetical protein